jgi:hypothetical protein
LRRETSSGSEWQLLSCSETLSNAEASALFILSVNAHSLKESRGETTSGSEWQLLSCSDTLSNAEASTLFILSVNAPLFKESDSIDMQNAWCGQTMNGIQTTKASSSDASCYRDDDQNDA